jgi:hypothetical protein
MSVTLIATSTSTSAFAQFDFQSISSAYTDLFLIINAAGVSSGAYERLNLGINGESLTTQTGVYWSRGYSESQSSGTPTADRIALFNVGWVPDNNTAEQYATIYVHIPNYAGTQGNRIIIAKTGGARVSTPGAGSNAFGWTSGIKTTSTAISRITLGLPTGGNLRGGSYANLYGITKGGSGTVTAS